MNENKNTSFSSTKTMPQKKQTTPTLFSFVRFVRNELEEAFSGVNTCTIESYNDDEQAEEMVCQIKDHAQKLIELARFTNIFPDECKGGIVDDDDLAVIFSQGHLYERKVDFDVQIIREELS